MSQQDTPQELNLTPMLAQYMALKKEHADCLLFFRLGDFYELFFEDAQKASKVLNITLTRRGKSGGDDIPMCGVPFHAAENYLARLIRQGFKVAICEQLESPEEAKKNAKLMGGKPIVKRDVVRIITPGTLTEETLLDPHHHNYLAALVVLKEKAACASVDVSTGDFFLESLEIGDIASTLTRMGPSEILIAENILQKQDIESSLRNFKKNLTFLPSHRFDLINGERRLKEIFKVESLSGFGTFNPLEIIAGGVLLDYVLLTQKGKIPHLKHPQKITQQYYLEIDAATRRTLEISETQRGESEGSLFWAINRTITPFGSRLLSRRLKFPLKDPERIENRLDGVAFCVQNTVLREDVRTILKSTPDLNRIIGRLSLGRGGPRDLGFLREGLQKVSLLKTCLEKAQSFPKIMEHIHTHLNPLEDLQNHLNQALDSTKPLPILARDGDFVAAGFNNSLDECRRLKNSGHKSILELQNKYVQGTSVSSLKIKHNNILGYFVEITAQNASKLGLEFIHRQTLANVMRYTTVELSALEGRLMASKDEALQIELKIYDQLMEYVLSQLNEISESGHALASLDVQMALAQVAIEGNFTRPRVDDSLIFEVEEGRHWGVELSLKSAENLSFISNGCVCSGSTRLWLLTGPNMAGKSTFLRQNALLVILAQMGSFVPAKKMHLGVVDKLFSRVGASDDLARGQSTFMVEMIETAAILNQATERSFVILDEIGRGTATYDGLSIAWSCLEYLHNVLKSRTLFATHYHELTDLKQDLVNLFVAHMAIQEWQGNIVFLHRVKSGIANKSYGLHVARLAGLPDGVLTRAAEVLETLEATHEYREKPHSFKTKSSLPLFESASESKVEKILTSINPDTLTPIDALKKIYELKEVLGR